MKKRLVLAVDVADAERRVAGLVGVPSRRRVGRVDLMNPAAPLAADARIRANLLNPIDA